LADRYCRLVAASRWRGGVGCARLGGRDGSDLCVTVSIGAALLREDDTVATLLKRADESLYASKRAGRNRATLAEPRAAA
jgi:GGDEF domain-containing protein